jgi:hypothetical protein
MQTKSATNIPESAVLSKESYGGSIRGRRRKNTEIPANFM